MNTNDPNQVKGFQLLEKIGYDALDDDDLRRRLLDDPKSELGKAGLKIDADVEVVVHRNRPNLIHLVLPSKPTTKDPLDVNEVGLVTLIHHHPF